MTQDPETKTRKLFGTDGVRGIANQHPMTCETALLLGRAVAHQANHGTHRHKVLIGKDTRLSCYMLEMAFASGVCSMGVDTLLVGPLPTPAIAYLTQNLRADAGVIISASHNPYHDNGIKIFARDGFKLPDAKELELEQIMEDEKIGEVRPTKDSVGKAYRIDDASGRYIVALKNTFPSDLDLVGLKVVIDCAHGAGYRVSPKVLSELGAEVISIGVKPNGRNINDGCGALHPKHLAKAVLEHDAHIGIALDGDADRLVVVDEKGQVIHGDILQAMVAKFMIANDALHSNTLVTTVMSNLALDKLMHELGGQVVRTQVGDRYVVEAMRQGSYNLGGENSGHIVFLDHATTGDGMVAALQILAIMQTHHTKLSELASVLTLYPQFLENIWVKEKKPLAELESVRTTITKAEADLGDDGRVMVRYSGTEAKARVLVEGPDRKQADAWAKNIASAIEKAIG
jgi:phosphoglucosamine mutase